MLLGQKRNKKKAEDSLRRGSHISGKRRQIWQVEDKENRGHSILDLHSKHDSVMSLDYIHSMI